MSTPQHEKYEQQLKRKSAEAFAELPAEHEEAARASRTQLLNWLVTMDRVTKDPSELLDDNMGNTACNVLEDVLTTLLKDEEDKDRQKKLKAFATAFSNLSDDDQLNTMRAVLGRTLLSHARNCALLSRGHEIQPWENVGFHIDGDINCAFAKLGREPFQAIGFDDGERYIGTEGSKTLWVREFGMALILPYSPPFHVERHEVEPSSSPDSGALTDKEREKIEEVLGWFEEDSDAFQSTEPDEMSELKEKMRETVKLARIRLPRLDEMLDKLIDEHPEVGEDFENIDLYQLLGSCSEFLRMKLDDDSVRRDVEQTVLATGSLHDERRKLITTLIQGLAQHLPKEGDEPDSGVLLQRISEVSVSLPAVSEALVDVDPTSNVLDAAKLVLIWLQKELDMIPTVVPPTE